jgi:hypothetical protein
MPEQVSSIPCFQKYECERLHICLSGWSTASAPGLVSVGRRTALCSRRRLPAGKGFGETRDRAGFFGHERILGTA